MLVVEGMVLERSGGLGDVAGGFGGGTGVGFGGVLAQGVEGLIGGLRV